MSFTEVLCNAIESDLENKGVSQRKTFIGSLYKTIEEDGTMLCSNCDDLNDYIEFILSKFNITKTQVGEDMFHSFFISCIDYEEVDSMMWRMYYKD